MLFQVIPLRLPSGYSRPILTLRNEAWTSLPSPRLLVVDAGVCTASPLGVTFGQVIRGFKLFIYFSSHLCCPLRFQGLPQTHGESVSWCLETSLFFKTPFPRRISVPTTFVSLFVCYIFSYLLSKPMGCFSGCLMSSAYIQK